MNAYKSWITTLCMVVEEAEFRIVLVVTPLESFKKKKNLFFVIVLINRVSGVYAIENLRTNEMSPIWLFAFSGDRHGN